MKKLRVLTSAYACAPGGASERFGGGELLLGWNVVRQLGRFHEVWALTHSQNQEAIEKGLQPGDSRRLHFCYIQLPGLFEHLKLVQGGIQFYAYLWQVRAYFVARKLHRQVGFDVFHHVTYANDWMASYIGALLPVPYLRGPGGGAHRTPEALLGEYSLGSRLWERFRSFGQWVLRRDPFFVRGQRRAGVLLVCNREAAEAVPAPLRHKVQLFPVNGISTEDLRILGGENGRENPSVGLAVAHQALSGGYFEVLYAGKLLGLKGIGMAIRAFALFAGRHSDVRFSIIGDGPERTRLEALIQTLGVGDCIRLQRWMPRLDLLARMRECDVFLFPSLRDGGGGVVVEAMAAGKPVICMDLAGPGWHVTQSCGIKIPPQTTEQIVTGIAGALDRLYKDRDLLARMGKAARQRAEEVYVWDKLGDRLLEIYESVLGVRIQNGMAEIAGVVKAPRLEPKVG